MSRNLPLRQPPVVVSERFDIDVGDIDPDDRDDREWDEREAYGDMLSELDPEELRDERMRQARLAGRRARTQSRMRRGR